MKVSENYNEMLHKKASQEFEGYKESLMQMTPEQVMAHSYETVMKQDILACLEEGDLFFREAKALFRMEHPLEACYQEWLRNDYSHMDMLRDTIDDRARAAVQEQKKNERESR